MPVDMSEESVRIIVRISASSLWEAERKLAAKIDQIPAAISQAIENGAQAIEKLTGVNFRSGDELIRQYHLDEVEEVDKRDLRALQKEMKNQSVNFAIKKDGSGRYLAFYNAADAKRVRSALENVIKKQELGQEKKSMDAVIKDSVSKAEKRETSREAAKALAKTIERDTR